jgi:hypothetical protein
MATKTFQIVNRSSGLNLGNFDADSKQGALEALAREAGYDSYAEMQEVAPAGEDELRVTEIEHVVGA